MNEYLDVHSHKVETIKVNKIDNTLDRFCRCCTDTIDNVVWFYRPLGYI